MAPDLVWHWRPRNSSDLSHLNIPLAVQRFVSDQLDLASKETNGQHKLHWKHDDLRQCSLDTRRERKVRLCQRIPGLLSGAHWSALHLDSWLPIYVVLAKLSPSELISTNYATDLRYYSVVWEHESGSLGLSIYSNHHDPQLILQHFSDNMLSTSDHGVEKLGNKTRTSLSHAAQYLFQLTKKAAPKDDTSSLSSQSPSASSGLSLRLGNSVGVLGWRKAQDGFADQATLQLSDLTPPSLEPSQKSQDVHTSSTNLFSPLKTGVSIKPPMINLARRSVQDDARSRVTTCYKRRFKMHMSENLTQDDEVTDPSHERSFVQPDEFVVTVLGLPAMLSPEYIFSGVFGLTPLPRFWSIPGLAQTPTEPPAFDFYVPDNEGTVGAARPKFYSCDRLVSYGPRMCYLGINYSGRLEFSADGVVALRGPLYEKYKVSLSAAADGAFRANPELAQELAWDILSDTGEDDGTIGRVLRPANMEGAEAYRTAFDAAWRKRDTKLTPEDRLYPYVDEKEMDLVDEFDLVGVRVLPHVRIILERSGAFPDIKDYARSLLLQAPVSTKVQETPGYDRMKRGMVSLLPDATEDRISMRLFEHRYPQVVWDEATKTIIVREPDPCLDHAEGSRCMCWVGPYLHEAAEDYCNVRADASGSGEPSLRSMFRAFLQCMNGVADMRDVSSDHMDIHDAEVVLSHLQPTVDEDDDNELGYVTPEPRAAPVIEQSLQADGTPISTVSAVVGDEHEATPPVEAAEFVLGSGLEYPQASPHTPQAMSTDPAEDEHPGIDTEEHCVDEETLENLVPGVEGDPRQLPVGDLLLYCGGLIQFRVTKELQAAGQRIALLTEEQARLEDSLAEHVKAEEDLKATLDSRLAEFADFQRDLELKDGLLREKEALIAALKQSLRVQDERIKKLEATVRQQEGRLLEKKRKAMEAIEKLFGGPDEAQNTEDEEDQLEEERPPRKLLRTANGTSSQPGSPSTLLTPRRKVVNGVATPVRSSGSPRNLLSSVPASRQKPRHAISPAYTDQE